MSLQTAINQFNRKVVKLSEEEFRARCLTLMNEAIKLTPVDTGRLRANWQATLNSPAQSSNLVTDLKSATKGATGQRATHYATQANASTVNKMKAKDVFYLTNNLVYAVPVEFGGPTNRPRRMLTRAIQKVSML